MRLNWLILAVSLVACSPKPRPIPAEPPATEVVSDVPTTQPSVEPGAKCDPQAGCAGGLECVTYYGIAGPSGPAFHSCEIRCDKDASACPAGQKCITIADGPGQVCRQETAP